MSEVKRIGKHSLVYGAGIVASKLASFLMLPIYTRFLTPADYGVLELLSMTIDVIGTIAGVGLGSAVFKFFEDYDNPDDRNEVMSTSAIGVVGLALVTALLGLTFAPVLNGLILPEHGDPLYFRLFFFIYLAQSCEIVPLFLIRAQERSKLFVTLSVSKLVLQLSLNIYFVVGLRMGVLGVLYGNLIATAVMAVGECVYLIRTAGVSFSSTKFMAMVRFGYPMVFVSLGNFVLVFSDRYFLNFFAGAASVGIYSLAYKFAFILSSFAGTPFGLVWAPRRFVVAKRADAQEVYGRVFLYLNLVLGALALGIALFARDVIVVMADPAFHDAFHLVPLVIAAQVAMQWTGFYKTAYLLTSQTGQFARISLANVAIVLLLNALLIPVWGAYGAALATIAAYGIRFVMVYYFSQQLYRIPFPWRPVTQIYAIVGGAVLLRQMIGDQPVITSTGISGALVVLAVAAVYRFVLGPEDRDRIRSFVTRPRAALGIGA